MGMGDLPLVKQKTIYAFSVNAYLYNNGILWEEVLSICGNADETCY